MRTEHVVSTVVAGANKVAPNNRKNENRKNEQKLTKNDGRMRDERKRCDGVVMR